MNFLVLDLEFAEIPCERRIFKRLGQEIIQIGWVLMDENFNTISTYSSFVHPSYGGILNRYVSNLTNIKSSDLKNAPSAKQVIEHLSSLIDEDTYLVTWSENDCKQLERQLDLEFYTTGKELEVSDYFIDSLYDYIDVQEIFAQILNTRRKYRLCEALWISGVADSCDNYHDALGDAWNTAILFKKTQLEEEFTFSPYYIPSDLVEPLHYDPFRQRCFA